MYQRLFLYSRNQIAIKNINILLDPALSAEKKLQFLTFFAKNTISDFMKW